MEGDEIEMSKEDLQSWIREEVQKSKLISPDVSQRCNLLESLLQRREKQAAHFQKLCESVAACEEIVKKQYILLGWEYKDTDSDDGGDDVGGDDGGDDDGGDDDGGDDDGGDDDGGDDDGGDDIADSGCSPPSPWNFVHSETAASKRLTPLLPKLQYSDSSNSSGKSCSSSETRDPVVVLTRLPECASSPSSSLNDSGDTESSISTGSDMQWEPDDSSDSNYSISSYKTRAKKRKRTDEKKKKPTAPQASTKTHNKSNTNKTSTPQARTAGSAESKGATTSPPQTSTNSSSKSTGAKTSTAEGSKHCSAKKSSTSSTSTNGVTNVVTIAALCQSNETSKKAPPCVPQRAISVNMKVLARRCAMNWQRGEIMEIITKEDGRVKYKINFEEKGRGLVSGHHIAFDCMPKVDHLFVGARVVVKCRDEQTHFSPGILAELPSRKNRMRFLVFFDDHTPNYVALPLLYIVCRPLEDPLDDIPDELHKSFMKEYLKSWPYPLQTQYKVGQIINAELDGRQQRCEVLQVDCSIMQVAFQKGQHKDWIYRGSTRLEHMVNIFEKVDTRREENRKNWVEATKKVT